MQWYGEGKTVETLSDFYRDYHKRMHGRDIQEIRMIQMIKLVTEVGEAFQEFEGTSDYNPRKGAYSDNQKVAKELGDVIGTAMIGLFLFCADPEKIVEDTFEKFYTRMEAHQNGEQAQ